MSKVKLETLKKEEKPVVAICYDFDKTLSPDDMQAQGFIQKLGYKSVNFGRNPMDLPRIIIWTRILPICLR